MVVNRESTLTFPFREQNECTKRYDLDSPYCITRTLSVVDTRLFYTYLFKSQNTKITHTVFRRTGSS